MTRRIAAASLIGLGAMLACAPRESARTDSAESAAAATAAAPAVASPATAAESAAVSSGSTTTRAPAAKSSSTRTTPEDTGRIIGRDSARTIDPRDPRRRLPVVPPSTQR